MVTTVPRDPAVPGDPTYHAMRRAIAEGALPFTCQGPDNAFAIEGGHTLGFELADQLASDGTTLDRLFIQVGGGALAASMAQALEEAAALGVVARLPRIHAVQSRNVHPLVSAYRHVVAYLAPRLGIAEDVPEPGAPRRLHGATSPIACARSWRAAWPRRARGRAAPSVSVHAPDGERRSVAGGIVDDETYDWFAVVPRCFGPAASRSWPTR